MFPNEEKKSKITKERIRQLKSVEKQGNLGEKMQHMAPTSRVSGMGKENRISIQTESQASQMKQPATLLFIEQAHSSWQVLNIVRILIRQQPQHDKSELYKRAGLEINTILGEKLFLRLQFCAALIARNNYKLGIPETS